MPLTEKPIDIIDVKPTIPSEVNSNTPLERLNLNWKERDLPEKERTKHVHRLHPYLGKFIPQLVEVFLRKYFKPGQIILDPFCGSGTTLVQANELGINSIGYDVSAFNVLLAKVKTQKYDVPKVRHEVLDILKKANYAGRRKNLQLNLWENNEELNLYSEPDNNYLQEWYSQPALKELIIYRRLIETGEYQYKNLLKVILSRSARSARLTTHFELDFPKRPQKEPYWCYKHSRTCKPTDNALKFLHRYSLDTLKRIEEFSLLRTNSSTEVYHADSRLTSLPPIDGVITSPPYVGLIDYHAQHIYAYHLLGLEDNRENEIGPAVHGSSIKAQQLYQEELAKVFLNAKNTMPVGGRMIVIAADKKELFPEIAKMIDIEVEDIVHRHVNRRTGRRSSEFYESVFIWKKK